MTCAVPRRRVAMHGLSLIELMIAMVLGLLLMGAAISIFLSNQRVFRTVEGMGWAQDGMQTTFELMARDLREAGGNPCDGTLPVANVINNASSNWWTNWSFPIVGYDNGALSGSASGTDAIQVLTLDPHLANVTAAQSSTNITVDDASGLSAGNTVMICDNTQLALFVAGSVTGNVINHASSANCSNNSLSVLPAVCSGSAPAYSYGVNSVVSRLRGIRWYVASNANGGRSLYRKIDNGAAEEMVEGVQDMQITYLTGTGATAYQTASAIGAASPPAAAWGNVIAVRLVLTVRGGNKTGFAGQQLDRTVQYVVNLRNRTL
ncbi:PilW family protein [Xanthomonas sacchari]|uniref:PilW family protein n=1 Tax=Xanthomonas sacchari TaxID=56458 RepID=UPI0009E519AD|nr:PilW family protein [Xanthomonas sacchari]